MSILTRKADARRRLSNQAAQHEEELKAIAPKLLKAAAKSIFNMEFEISPMPPEQELEILDAYYTNLQQAIVDLEQRYGQSGNFYSLHHEAKQVLERIEQLRLVMAQPKLETQEDRLERIQQRVQERQERLQREIAEERAEEELREAERQLRS